MNAQNSGFTPSRRTLVKGAAWSVPVVAMAQPAMAVVCSPGNPECDPPVNPTIGQNSCKHTKGISRYHIELAFTNSQRCETNVVITSFTVAPFSGQEVEFIGVDYEFTIGAESALSWQYDSEVVGNMANGTVSVIYTYTDCSGATVEESQSINVSSLSPCDFAYPHDGEGEVAPGGADVKIDEAPKTTDTVTDSVEEPAAVEPAPAAPAEPVEPAPVEPAPADGAAESSTP